MHRRIDRHREENIISKSFGKIRKKFVFQEQEEEAVDVFSPYRVI